MPFPTTSQWVGKTIADALNGTVSIDLDSATANAFKVAMFTNSLGTFTNDNTSYSYGSGIFAANEVTDSQASYVAGGKGLSTPTLVTTANKTVWSADNTTWAASTISDAYGAIVYHASSNRVLAVAYFGAGVPFSTTNGTFTIDWDNTNGIAYQTF